MTEDQSVIEHYSAYICFPKELILIAGFESTALCKKYPFTCTLHVILPNVVRAVVPRLSMTVFTVHTVHTIILNLKDLSISRNWSPHVLIQQTAKRKISSLQLKAHGALFLFCEAI